MTEASKQNTGQQHGHAAPNGGWAGVLFMAVIVLACLALLGFGTYIYLADQMAQSAEMQARLDRLNTRLHSESQRTDSFKTDIVDRLAHLNEALEMNGARQDEALHILSENFSDILQSAVQKQASLQHNAAIKQAIGQQATYLLQAADLSLLLETSHARAIQYLERTDALLGKGYTPELRPVRKQLAKHLLTLRSEERLHRTKHYFALSAMIEQLQQLPLQLAWTAPQPQKSKQTATLHPLLERLLALVTIKVRQTPQVRSPQIASLARQHLALNLEQAQIALLRRQPKIYKDAITGAQRILTSYLDMADASVQQLAIELDALLEVSITSVQPDIGHTLLLLEQYQRLPAEVPTRPNAESTRESGTGNARTAP